MLQAVPEPLVHLPDPSLAKLMMLGEARRLQRCRLVMCILNLDGLGWSLKFSNGLLC